MKRVLQGAFAGTLLCAAGCLTTVDSVENYEKTYTVTEEMRLHIETDASMKIKVTDLIVAENPDNGFKLVAFTLTNRSTSRQSASYQLEWFDENGMSVPTSLKQWTDVTLLGRDTKQVRFTAPNARAKDYKIRLIEKK